MASTRVLGGEVVVVVVVEVGGAVRVEAAVVEVGREVDLVGWGRARGSRRRCERTQLDTVLQTFEISFSFIRDTV